MSSVFILGKYVYVCSLPVVSEIMHGNGLKDILLLQSL
jgi:hypothetical protein